MNKIYTIFFIYFLSLAGFSQSYPDTLKIGVYNNPPKLFIDANHNPKGIFIDITNAIVKHQNISIQYVSGNWIDLKQMLIDGKIDVLPDVAYSNSRDSIFSFSTLPILGSWFEIFSRQNASFHTISDLQNKTIGVLSGSIQEEYFQKTKMTSYTIKSFQTYEEIIIALQSYNIDAFAATRFFHHSNLYKHNIAATGIILSPTELYFAFTKNRYPELIELFDKQIATLKNNPHSELYLSLQTWLQTQSEYNIPKSITWLIFIILSILFIISLFALMLHITIKRRTKELNAKNKELIHLKAQAEEREQQFLLLANNIPNSMIYQISVNKELQRTFRYVSGSVEKFYGCTTEEAMLDAQKIYSKIHPDDAERVILHEEDCLRNFSIFNIETRMQNPDGTYRWSLLISSPRISKELIIWDGIEIDISQQKQTEQDLIQAKEKAEENERLKRVFLQNMSHEIRTPLNGILGFLSLISDSNLDQDTQKKYIEIASSSGQRLLSSINDIVELSRIESNQVHPSFSLVNINDIFENLQNKFQPICSSKSITLSIHIETQEYITSDNVKLERILSNLIDNAIKFTRSGGITVGTKLEKESILFYVQDTGLGIPAERIDAIFDSFVQADLNITRPYEGVGIGLSIVKAYVQMLQGKIWVESKIEKGSTFFIAIPHNSAG